MPPYGMLTAPQNGKSRALARGPWRSGPAAAGRNAHDQRHMNRMHNSSDESTSSAICLICTRHPKPNGMVVAGRGEDVCGEAPRDHVNGPRVAGQDVEQRSVVPIPNVHLAVLAPARHEPLSRAAKRRAEHQALLRVAAEPAHEELALQVPQLKLLRRGGRDQEGVLVPGEAERGEHALIGEDLHLAQAELRRLPGHCPDGEELHALLPRDGDDRVLGHAQVEHTLPLPRAHWAPGEVPEDQIAV
mmetsp:Transcript_21519/g.72437  ORF Transcript_21519/g.72437 Transcript_21519/m.72437 type:complete len:245 (-) Transcript_21519:1045-1779(-)